MFHMLEHCSSFCDCDRDRASRLNTPAAMTSQLFPVVDAEVPGSIG